jgi:F-type H+-transporting ATPase subunit epsilon
MAPLQCIVVTPERTVLDEPAEFVALTLYDGELGVAPSRTPMIGRLGYGELRILQNGRPIRYYVEGGFVEVAGDVVSVLTPRAMAADELDEAVVGEQLAAGRARPATTPDAIAARDHDVLLSRARLRVARRAR